MAIAPDDLHESLDLQFAFGPFCVTPGKRLLTQSGSTVDIGGRALDLLIALLERPGRVMSKRELIKLVWPDSVVSEGSLRFHMTGLRRILGDGEAGARYIATQVGVGYAFVASLERRQPNPSLVPPARATQTGNKRFTSAVGTLPARTRLIGRDDDIQMIVERLQAPELFTIVGPGGVGKTSLAVEVGHRLAAECNERVRFVDLAQVEDAALVPSSLAASLGIAVQAEDTIFALLAHLRDARLVLIIDNCEHLIDAVSAIVEQIRDAAPQVGLLTTSREPLRSLGEQVYRLNPLDFPAEVHALNTDELLAYPAVKLFVERASSGNASLHLDASDAQMIADICRRLEGMALPIELAAVRVATHGVHATHALLGERFSLGWSGRRTALPRHQTLRAMLDWSYALLGEQEKYVFDCLAIFVGPFSLEAASQILADGQIDVVTAAATLDDLASKGLVSVDHSDAIATYRLLEMTRAYAREKLANRSTVENHGLSFRHAAYFMGLLGRLGTTPDEIMEGSARLANQLGNIRNALEWSFGPQGDPGLALPLAAASAPLFLHFSLMAECRTWCSRATELLELGYFGTSTEMELQAALGLVLMFTLGNSEAAQKALLRALHIAQALGDHWSCLRLLGRLQIFSERIGDFPSSLAWAEQAVEVGNLIGKPEAVAVAASLAGICHHLLGNQKLARKELERSLRNSLPSERSNTLHYGFDHRNRTGLALARTLWLLGFPDQARRWAEQVEAEAAALEHSVTYCIALVWTLGIYIWTGDLEKASTGLETFTHIAEANALAPYIAAAMGLQGAIAIRAGRPGNAVALLEESLARLQGMRYELLTTAFETSLAEGLVLDGQHEKALAQVETTIRHCRRSGDAYALPELLRIKASILKTLAPDNVVETLGTLQESITLSQQQGARSWELRASMDLASVWLEQGHAAQAKALLSDCHERMNEGHDTLDLRQLHKLWQRTLAETAGLDQPAPTKN
ncbi:MULTISPECIES: ATP-binding protein [Pseudomonas]|uniref:ATP-binding protein n=1 Tax=Pseudomonas TaxID=286 RepID=UPI00070C066F|nr:MULTISPECIES: winged helix-turn-helix domain-containing protein [Pseudomonas]KQW28446.1 transcriptional regulator [Pseudomonas sp. Root401]WHS56479.1 winged helix-turn-helix domain-containing protein [Pseudomonas brassicacearum]